MIRRNKVCSELTSLTSPSPSLPSHSCWCAPSLSFDGGGVDVDVDTCPPTIGQFRMKSTLIYISFNEQKRAGPEFFAEFFVGAQPATA